MGCTWAVYWCQNAHTQILEAAGVLTPDTNIADFSPPPKIAADGTAGAVYIDNGLFVSLSKDLVADTALDAAGCLRKVGLPVHEEVGGVSILLILGLQICGDPLRIIISPDRRHRLRQALRGFCRRGKA